MKQTLKRIFTWLTSIGVQPQDDEETRLNKSLLVLSSIPFMIAGMLWGLMYILFGEVYAGLIPLSYSVFSFFSLVFFANTCKFGVYRFTQLLLILLLPFALMVALGGYVKGSA